jgi:hypothetical protein
VLVEDVVVVDFVVDEVGDPVEEESLETPRVNAASKSIDILINLAKYRCSASALPSKSRMHLNGAYIT